MITRAEVEKVALLARLQFSDEETERLTDHLRQILDYVAQLDELETADVVPMAHAGEITNVLVADQVQPGLERAEALANAPKKDDQCYRVPAVLGD